MQRLDRRAAVLALLGAAATPAAAAPAAPAAQIGPAEDMTLGRPGAKVKVVEYASASCSHCADFHREVFPTFKARYIDTGKVHYTLKEFLTAPPELAAAGFLLARCSGRARYFQTLDAVFRSQAEWPNGDIRGSLLKVAKGAGLTEPQFEACLTDETALAALNRRMEAAVRAAQIRATPTFLINGEKAFEGAPTLEALEGAIATAARR